MLCCMLGLDLSRKRVDVCLISSEGELIDHFRGAGGSRRPVRAGRRVAVYDEPVRGVVESMNGARFVHDELVALWVGGAGRRRAAGQGAGAVGVQDRQDRRARAGGAVVPRSGAGDLAADAGAAPRARALAVAAAPGQAPLDPQEPGALDADRVRPPGPDGRPVRRWRPPAARASSISPSRGVGHVDASVELIDDLEPRISRDRALSSSARAPITATSRS